MIHDILNELKKRKIIYLKAPCGWGKTVLLHQLEETVGSGKCAFIHHSEMNGQTQMMDMNKVRDKKEQSKIFLIDDLEEWVISGKMELLVNDIRNQSPERRYILAGRIPLPSCLLPYKLTSQISIYDKTKLKYSEKELHDICTNNHSGSEEEIRSLYEVCHGMPLFLAVAEGFLEGVAVNDESSTAQ